MKKYISKKNIFLAIILILSFFTVYKYIKGKSLFDTLLEYSNNIFSINAEVEKFDFDLIDKKKEVYIPTDYEVYIERAKGIYVVKKENDNSLYIYDINKKEEKLLKKISSSVIVSNIKVLGSKIIWSELDKRENGDNKKEWTINLRDGKKELLIDSGFIGEGDKIPDNFDISDGGLVYRKHNREKFAKGNIISSNVFTSIAFFDFKNNTLSIIDEVKNPMKETLYMPKIKNGAIAYQKVFKDVNSSEADKTAINLYNTATKKIKKIYETSKVDSFDIANDSIAVITKNPYDNIDIIDLNDGSIRNIFYKGSKIEKKYGKKNDLDILDIKYINDDYILTSVVLDGIAKSVIYDMDKQIIYELDEYSEKYDKKEEGIYYFTRQEKLYAVYGGVTKESIKDKDNSNSKKEAATQGEEQKNIEEEFNYYYKLNTHSFY